MNKSSLPWKQTVASLLLSLALFGVGPHAAVLQRLEQLLLLVPGLMMIWGFGRPRSSLGKAEPQEKARQIESEESESSLKDLQLATLVQQSLLSQPLQAQGIAIDAKYVPSHHLGGDMYAWYQLDERRVGVVIMDVMGSGVAASLICMSIRSLLEGVIRKCVDPELVMKELNDHMYKLFRKTNSPASFYFTALYVLIDTESRTMEYINAGHSPGFLLDADSDIRELSSSCVPIGLMRELRLEKQTLVYTGTARVVLYTDGLIESPGVSLQIKQEEIKQILVDKMTYPSASFIEALLQINHHERLDHPDDVCVVCIDL